MDPPHGDGGILGIYEEPYIITRIPLESLLLGGGVHFKICKEIAVDPKGLPAPY